MKKISLGISKFYSRRNVVIDTILQHRRESECNECQWTIAVVGYDNLKAIKEFNKPCLLKIDIELELLGGAVETLIRDHGFVEDATYRPSYLGLVGAVLVYCET